MLLPAKSWLGVMAFVGVSAIGCGDDPVSDAGPPSPRDGGDASPLVTPPNIPWLADGVPPLSLAPCPEGWHEVHGGAVTECDPYPEGGAESCNPGEAHFPGEAGCRPIGDACPSGNYATSLPSGGPIVYVQTGAVAGGDGSLATPYAMLSEVPWASLAAGTTVAVGKGTYPGILSVKAGVNVIGACVEETIVTGLATPVPAVVLVPNMGDPAVVRNLTIRGAPQRGAMVRDGRALRLEGMLIDQVRGIAVVGDDPGSDLTLVDVVIRDTRPSVASAVEAGIGIHLQGAVSFEATRLLVVENRFIGVSVTAGSTATFTDTVIRGTRPGDVDGVGGRGLDVESQAEVEATRLLVSSNREIGVFMGNAGTTMSMTDVIVRDTESQLADGEKGTGVSVADGARLTAAKMLVAGNRGMGIFVNQPGSHAALTDVVARHTRARPRGLLHGRGVSVEGGARLEATRLLIADNDELGFRVAEPGSTASLFDVVIQGTAATAVTGDWGRGLSVVEGAHLEGARLLITDNREISLNASDEGTSVNISDMVIRDTGSRASDTRFGRGVHIQLGASLDGERLEIERSLGLGVLAIGGATVTLTDASVRHVEVADCATTLCPEEFYGYGVAALAASVSMTRFQVMHAAICGVLVGPVEERPEAASLDLTGGVVSEATIGACVQVDGYDFDRLTNDVAFRDNGTNLDTTTLPVPTLGGLPLP